jgi:hypothetical protein
MIMQSWYTTSRARLARLVLITASSAAFGSLAACGGGGGDSAPLTRAVIKVQSITQQGNCEDVNIKVTPVSVLPGAPKMSNQHEFITPVALKKGADNVSCTGNSTTIPMAPGKWKFTANLPSENATCERDIAPAGTNDVDFKDGDVACPQQAPKPDAAAPAADAGAAPAAAPADSGPPKT